MAAFLGQQIRVGMAVALIDIARQAAGQHVVGLLRDSRRPRPTWDRSAGRAAWWPAAAAAAGGGRGRRDFHFGFRISDFGFRIGDSISGSIGVALCVCCKEFMCESIGDNSWRERLARWQRQPAAGSPPRRSCRPAIRRCVAFAPGGTLVATGCSGMTDSTFPPRPHPDVRKCGVVAVWDVAIRQAALSLGDLRRSDEAGLLARWHAAGRLPACSKPTTAWPCTRFASGT